MNPIPDSCLAYDEDLSALHDGELDAARSEEVRSHVAACERCRTLLARFGAVDAALRSTASPEVSPALEAAILAHVARESGAGSPSHARRGERTPRGVRAGTAPRRFRAGLAAALAIAAGIALWLSVPAPPPLTPGVAPLEAVSEEDLSLALELETLEDLDVIANLDLLEAAPPPENDRG